MSKVETVVTIESLLELPSAARLSAIAKLPSDEAIRLLADLAKLEAEKEQTENDRKAAQIEAAKAAHAAAIEAANILSDTLADALAKVTKDTSDSEKVTKAAVSLITKAASDEVGKSGDQSDRVRLFADQYEKAVTEYADKLVAEIQAARDHAMRLANHVKLVASHRGTLKAGGVSMAGNDIAGRFLGITASSKEQRLAIAGQTWE